MILKHSTSKPLIVHRWTNFPRSVSQSRIARRDANRQKWQDKRNAGRGEKTEAVQERRSAMQDRDKANMEMFMKMAKEKFG